MIKDTSWLHRSRLRKMKIKGSIYNCVLETKPVQIFSMVENIVGGLQVEALLDFGEGA